MIEKGQTFMNQGQSLIEKGKALTKQVLQGLKGSVGTPRPIGLSEADYLRLEEKFNVK
jgi:hypothetical protein